MSKVGVFVLLMVFSLALANTSKLSYEVRNRFYTISRRDGEEIRNNIWVFFTDKGNTHNQYVKISEKAINRRKKMNISYTQSDIPVNENYVQQIVSITSNNAIRTKSNWLNSISVLDVNVKQLEQIITLPFVHKVEIISVYTKKQPDTNPTPTTIDSHKRNDYGRSAVQLSQIRVIEAHNMGK